MGTLALLRGEGLLLCLEGGEVLRGVESPANLGGVFLRLHVNISDIQLFLLAALGGGDVNKVPLGLTRACWRESDFVFGHDVRQVDL